MAARIAQARANVNAHVRKMPKRAGARAKATAHSESEEPKVCVVTGASRGIGKAVAVELGSRGNKVVVNYSRSKGPAEEVCNEIEGSGGEAIPVQANVAEQEGVDGLFKACTDHFGTPGVLVNNAGITKDSLLMRMKDDQWQDVIDLNLTGVFRCCQAATRLMGRQRQGRIVNLSSVVGLTGNPGQANYSAAKGGVVGLTKSIAREYAARNVTCNAVAPGFIASDMTSQLSSEVEGRILSSIPLGRYGKPEEVAGLIRFLTLDPASAYITGECISIDGGMVM